MTTQQALDSLEKLIAAVKDGREGPRRHGAVAGSLRRVLRAQERWGGGPAQGRHRR